MMHQLIYQHTYRETFEKIAHLSFLLDDRQKKKQNKFPFFSPKNET